MHSSNASKVQSPFLRKLKLDPCPVGCQSQCRCLRILCSISEKGQHAYLASAAFAFKRTGTALSGLCKRSWPSNTKAVVKRALRSLKTVEIVSRMTYSRLRYPWTPKHMQCRQRSVRKNQSLTCGLYDANPSAAACACCYFAKGECEYPALLPLLSNAHGFL